MIRLSDLRAPCVALEWHEAVAVAAAFTAAVWNARLSHTPTLEGAILTQDGEVELTGTTRAPGSVTNGLAAGLAALLESTPCPAELRQLVMQAAGTTADVDTVHAFSRALMFFERPGRQQVLRELAARAEVASEQARASAALEELTERARQAAPPPPRKAIVVLEVASTARRMAGPAAVAGTVFIAVALAAATLFTTAQAPDTTAMTGLGPIVDDEAPARASGSSSPGAYAATRAETPSASVARPIGKSGGSGAGAAARGAAARDTGLAATSPSGAGESDVLVTVTEIGGAPLPSDATVPIATAALAATATARIFSAADAGVAPAILVKPHLPAEPPSDVPPWEVGTLELTVSTTGVVEQVHLISPYNRFQERMLVAAAKAWQFQPATKDGRPVRFRARIRVTL